MTPKSLALTVAICCTVALHAADKNPYEDLSKEKRIESVRRAQVWNPIDTSSLDLKAGPQREGAIEAGTTVTCEYFDKDSGGKTPKFWCRLSPDDEVKVKYGEDNGEVYGEVAATRLLWALGFGADAMYPARVTCRGCSADPFTDKSKGSEKTGKKSSSPGSAHTFDPAVIERPMAGDKMESGKDSGWGWIDLDSVDQARGGAPVAHRDALKLLAVFMQHTDTKPSQQRLVCLDNLKGLPVSGDGSCANPFMMLADLGKTFGKANAFNKDNPGSVNLKAWAGADIWRGDSGCVGDMDQSFTGTLNRPRISEAGRKFLADRLMQLSDQQIRDLFESAGFARRDETTTVEDWVRVFKQKRDDIVNRTCTIPTA